MKSNAHKDYFEGTGLQQNCKKATWLVSTSFERRLSVKERLGLFFHLLVCSGCRLFKKQVRFLQQRLPFAAGKAVVPLPAEEKEKLNALIRKKLNEGK